MKSECDLSKGKRGAVIPAPRGTTRITIRIDDDILDWFRNQVEATGGGNYCPESNVTRTQMAGLLVRTFMLP